MKGPSEEQVVRFQGDLARLADRKPAMINHVSYRKFVTLGNESRAMFRFFNGQDRHGFTKMFQEVSEQDALLLKQDFTDPEIINYWLDHIDYRRVLPLVAVDLSANRIIASANLYKGKHTAKHIGEIRTFVSEPYRNLGLGSLMLDELVNLAMKENLQWLKAEVAAQDKKMIKALRRKDFHIRAILDDFFLAKDGTTYDVALMVRPVLEDEAEF